MIWCTWLLLVNFGMIWCFDFFFLEILDDCDEESQQRGDVLASLDDVDRNWAAFRQMMSLSLYTVLGFSNSCIVGWVKKFVGLFIDHVLSGNGILFRSISLCISCVTGQSVVR